MSKQLFARIPRRPARGPPYEPTARLGHCAAVLNGKVFTFSGRPADFDRVKKSLAAQVETFDLFTETWSQDLEHTTGDPPPGLYYGCCTTCAGLLYHYGGCDLRTRYSSLSKYDSASLNWTLVGKDSRNGPMPKNSCAMVCFGEMLWVFAGYGTPTGPVQLGSTFSEDQSGSGRTNELHSFHTRIGTSSYCSMHNYAIVAAKRSICVMCRSVVLSCCVW